MKLSDFYKEGDGVLDRIDYPLFRAMATKTKELEVTPEEFVMCMRYAVQQNVYAHVQGVDIHGFEYSYPTILAMKIIV